MLTISTTGLRAHLHRSALAGPLLLLLLAGLPVLAQTPDAPAPLDPIEEEELDELDETGALDLGALDTASTVDAGDFEALYERASTLYPESALPQFGQLIALLETELARANDEALQTLLARSLARRAELSAELGDLDSAALDLEKALAARPDFELAPGAPAALHEMLERLREQRLGILSLRVEPPDAVLLVDGRPTRLSGGDSAAGGEAALRQASVVAGIRQIEVSRPGFLPYREEIEIRGGRSTELELELERQSAVISVQTRPVGAEVWLDGELRGSTGKAETDQVQPVGITAIQPGLTFSEPLHIAPVELGLRLLEIKKDGFRPYRAELQIGDLLDYQMPPVVLEAESGTLVFKGMPQGAAIEIDGETRQPDDPHAPEPRLTLPPGSYAIRIAESDARVFATDLRLADRQTIEVNVRLRPGLVLLGVLGGSEQRSADLLAGLRMALSKGERWTVIDPAARASRALQELGVDAAALRADRSGASWAAARASLTQRFPGLLYALAVLDDDLVSDRADLWIWAAPPAPRKPDLVQLNLGEISDLEALTRRFDRRLYLRRPWVGALVIDSGVTAHPLVAQIGPESPAAKAGLRPGDQIVAVAKVPVFSRRDYEQRISAAETGETIELAVQSSTGPRTLKVALGSSPRVLEDLGDMLPSVAFTDLVLQAEDEGGRDLWVVQLNQALIALRAGDHESAVRLLRQIEVPAAKHGLSRPAVDYWLGVALLKLGPSHEEAAADAFRKAATVPDARLFHHDGPWVAPRARARLQGGLPR